MAAGAADLSSRREEVAFALTPRRGESPYALGEHDDFGGSEVIGSWRAATAFLPRIGTINRGDNLPFHRPAGAEMN